MSCGVGRRHGSDLVRVWLWLTAIALIRPLSWEPPYAMGAALKSGGGGGEEGLEGAGARQKAETGSGSGSVEVGERVGKADCPCLLCQGHRFSRYLLKSHEHSGLPSSG